MRTISQDGDLTDTKTKQLEFWQQLKEFAATSHPELKLRTPRPQHWFDVAVGRSDCHVSLVVDSRENKVRCELYIPDSKELYQDLLSFRAEIEKELSIAAPLEWQELPGKKASRIRALRGFSFSDVGTWETAFGWLTETTSKFKRVFVKDWKRLSSQQTTGGDGLTAAPQLLSLTLSDLICLKKAAGCLC